MSDVKIHCLFDEMVSPKKLKDHKKNNNRHGSDQVERLAKILEYQGFRQPVKVSKQTGYITSGHCRKLAAIRLGLKQIPVVYQDYDNMDQEMADLYADNSIASWSDFDLGAVNDEIGNFDPSFDIELLGIKDFTLDAFEKDEPLTDEDAIPEKVEPKSKLGEIYQLGEHRLMCGDSTSIDDVNKLMGGNKADMVFTDPPYGVNYEGINNDSRDGLSDILSKSFDNYLLSMKDGASIYVFHSDKCADKFHEEFRKRFHFSSIAIWLKPSLVMGQSDYQSKHEPIIYGWKEGSSHSWFSDRKQTSVWEFGRESHKGHTTPKPVELVSYAIINSSKNKDNVLDLFGGSGSTLIACEKTNRKCYMMELDPHYIDVIIARWEQYTGKKAELLNA